MTSNGILLVIGTVTVSYLLTCWALIDVAVKDFGSVEKKIDWGVIAFIPFIGWVVYLLWGRKKAKRRQRR